MTPSARSIAHMKSLGYQVANCDHYNYFTKRRHDLYGCIDLLCIGNGETVAVQVTSKSNMSSRIKKIEASEAFPEMLRSGWRVLVQGWFKASNGRYQMKEFEF
jgi:hypothetical protein